MKQHTQQKSDDTNTPRRAWTAPTSIYSGSVAELVQISKRSGSHDCHGTKRDGSGCS